MRLQQYLQEEYFKRIKNVFSETLEIFVNPSHKEMKEIAGKYKSTRFIADSKTKKLYTWGVYGSIHDDMYKSLSLGKNFQDDILKMKIMPGLSDVSKSGKSSMAYSEQLDMFVANSGWGLDSDSMYDSFKWVNKYMNIDNYFKKLRKVIPK
jgi:hypothetical protein